MNAGEAIARQIEAEQYDLAALELEQLIPPPDPPPLRPAICLHVRQYQALGQRWCSSCGRAVR